MDSKFATVVMCDKSGLHSRSTEPQYDTWEPILMPSAGRLKKQYSPEFPLWLRVKSAITIRAWTGAFHATDTTQYLIRMTTKANFVYLCQEFNLTAPHKRSRIPIDIALPGAAPPVSLPANRCGPRRAQGKLLQGV